MTFQIPKNLNRIVQELPGSYLVGGCVRDFLLGITPNDCDVEVFGHSIDNLGKILRHYGKVKWVGQSFGVFKVTVQDETYDCALPRRERKTGSHHRDFEININPNLTLKQAVQRRDFTINGLHWNPRTGKIIDHVNGVTDIQNKILRHIGPAFAEDPLRVLRGMQFASRFGFKATAETLELCRTISSTYPSLSKDRVWKEWTKWAAKAVQPSKGLQFLQASGWMQHFPQIQGLIGVPQNPKHHPEGDTWQHTLNVCDALARDPGWKNQPEDERAQLMLAALCHDFGKVTHTQITEAGITSYGHDEAGVEPTIAFLQEIGVPKTWEENISKLVRYHMSRIHQHTSRSVRRLAKKLEPARLDDLFLIMTADHNGRGASKLNPSSNVEKMRELAQACQVTNKPEKPILMGRHLLERGMQPGPEIGRLTQQAFEAQLNEEFNDIKGALAWLDQQAVVPTA